MKLLGTPLDAEVVNELKAMARRGAETKDLAAYIQASFGLHGDMHVPIFAYLGRAFPVSLRVFLPLREKGFDSPYARAVQVAFWLRVSIDDTFGEKHGNRSFPTWNPVTWQHTDSVTLEYFLDAATRSTLYARGTFCQFVAKDEELRASKEEIRQQTASFTSDVEKMLSEVTRIHPESGHSDAVVACEFEINDKGAGYEVTCNLRVIKDVSIRTPPSALQPTA